MATNNPKAPECVLDRQIVNDYTIGNMTDIGLSVFASLCGRNRGAFVLNPSDGHTWGCTSFPPTFAQLAGAEDSEIILEDANAIKQAFIEGNITASDTVTILEYFLQAVYHSSAHVDQDMYACEMGGLAKLKCDQDNTMQTIRSVTMAGVFTPAPHVTGGVNLTLDEAKTYYTMEDFSQMSNLGLNTVQIPVPASVFLKTDTQDDAKLEYLGQVLGMLKESQLNAIIELTGEGDNEAVASAAHYAASDSTIIALVVPSVKSVGDALSAEPAIKVFVPIDQGDLKTLNVPDGVFAAMDLGHSTDIADIASSSSQDDRMKMFYHESKACIYRSALEYSACFRHAPVFVSKGFDLSIDDCFNEGTSKFIDYGQCDRFNETVNSPWWTRHRSSFAARQIFSYERGLGWSYTAWKLYGDDSNLLDTPAKLLAFRNVAAAGLIPSLTGDPDPATLACLNAPVSDFIMGDDTYAPTPAPPPDCYPGWWNFTINDCTYWVPPPPTSAPTVLEPVVCPEPVTDLAQIKAGCYGAVIALILTFLAGKISGMRRGYTPVGNVEFSQN